MWKIKELNKNNVAIQKPRATPKMPILETGCPLGNYVKFVSDLLGIFVM